MNNDLNEIKAMLAAILIAVGTMLGILINHIKQKHYENKQ